MATWKLSANAAFFGKQANAYTQYQPDCTLEDKLERIAQIQGIDGVELKYPFDLENVPLVKALLEHHELALSAVNVDIKNAEHFRFGALSARSAAARLRAADLLKTSMDIAADLGANLVTTCPLADGFDYAFELDYGLAWDHMVETLTDVMAHRDDVHVAIEYQPHEMHAKPLVNNVGKVLHLCHRVDHPLLGGNLDLGHAFAGQETPAEAAALLGSVDKLFHIHTNDSTGDGSDWDLISGAVHFWDWFEILFTLDRIGYKGWLGADIAAHRLNAKTMFSANTKMLLRLIDLYEQLDQHHLERLLSQDGNAADVLEYLTENILRC